MPILEDRLISTSLKERQILGLKFFLGEVDEVIARIETGGLLVVPSAPSFLEIVRNAEYRESVLNADMAITDSALMVLLWNWLQKDSIPRLSGLKYIRALLLNEGVRKRGNTFWVMAGRKSAEKNLAWLSSQGVSVPSEYVYEAPMYRGEIKDQDLLQRLSNLRPQHIVVSIGGGTQERLGSYLKRNLQYRPAIHCIGAAIAFLSGDQVRIPGWADRLYLGWFVRCLSSPGNYVPRYARALSFIPLLWKYRERLPPAAGISTQNTLS